MSLDVRWSVCVLGLVACSHAAAPAARGPGAAAATQAVAGPEPVAPPAAPERAVTTVPHLGALSRGGEPQGAAGADKENARTTSINGNADADESDPGLQQRIRQAAMADSLL